MDWQNTLIVMHRKIYTIEMLKLYYKKNISFRKFQQSTHENQREDFYFKNQDYVSKMTISNSSINYFEINMHCRGK